MLCLHIGVCLFRIRLFRTTENNECVFVLRAVVCFVSFNYWETSNIVPHEGYSFLADNYIQYSTIPNYTSIQASALRDHPPLHIAKNLSHISSYITTHNANKQKYDYLFNSAHISLKLPETTQVYCVSSLALCLCSCYARAQLKLWPCIHVLRIVRICWSLIRCALPIIQLVHRIATILWKWKHAARERERELQRWQ